MPWIVINYFFWIRDLWNAPQVPQILCFLIKAKINSMPDHNYMYSWSNPATHYYWFPSYYKNALFIINSFLQNVFFPLMNINWIERWQISSHMILCDLLMTYLLCCWALPILQTLELNLRAEVVRKPSRLSSSAVLLSRVPFSAISQVPHYLLQFHDFILRKKFRPKTPWLPHDKGQKPQRLAESVFWYLQEDSRKESCNCHPLQSQYAYSVPSPRGTSKCLFLLFLSLVLYLSAPPVPSSVPKVERPTMSRAVVFQWS